MEESVVEAEHCLHPDRNQSRKPPGSVGVGPTASSFPPPKNLAHCALRPPVAPAALLLFVGYKSPAAAVECDIREKLDSSFPPWRRMRPILLLFFFKWATAPQYPTSETFLNLRLFVVRMARWRYLVLFRSPFSQRFFEAIFWCFCDTRAPILSPRPLLSLEPSYLSDLGSNAFSCFPHALIPPKAPHHAHPLADVFLLACRLAYHTQYRLKSSVGYWIVPHWLYGRSPCLSPRFLLEFDSHPRFFFSEIVDPLPGLPPTRFVFIFPGSMSTP